MNQRNKLLNKGNNQYERFSQDIELEDFSIHRKINNYQNQQFQPAYQKMQEHKHPYIKEQIVHEKIQKYQKYDPTIIKMNGQTFKQVDSHESKPKKSKIPSMNVSCHHCTTVQLIPGNSVEFICGICSRHNNCEPILGIFRCGTCFVKVCYSIGTSQNIRCTKCNTVNHIYRYNTYQNTYQNNLNKKHKRELPSNPYEVKRRQEVYKEELLSENGELNRQY